jgi:catalase (peroxidase I)
MTNRLWWPHQLDLTVLHKHPPAGNPMPGSTIAGLSRHSTSVQSSATSPTS